MTLPNNIESVQDRQNRRVLFTLMTVAWIAYAFLILTGILDKEPYEIAVAIIGSILQLVPFILLLRGKTILGNWVLIFFQLVILVLFATYGQGYRDVGILAIPVIFVVAGLTLGRTALMITVGLVLASLAWLVFGQKYGWYQPLPIPETFGFDFIVITIILTVWAFAVDVLTTNMRKNLSQAQDELARRQKTERELLESETRYRQLLDNTDTGFAVTDDHGVVRAANEPYCRLAGFNRAEEVVGHSVIEWTAPQEKEKDARAVALCARQGYLNDFETIYQHRDGTRVHVVINATVETTGGGVKDIVSFCRNITDRKRAVEEHEKYELQLQKTQQLESIGILAAGIAHDFNNLLSIIYGNLQLLRMDPKRQDMLECLSDSLKTMERARSITNQLITFSRGGAPTKKTGTLAKFIPSVVQFTLSGSRIRPEFRIEQGLWSLDYDENQIGQVFENILLNAVQAMPGGGSLKVTAENVTLLAKQHPSLPEGNYVRVSFRDNGTGIAPEVQLRIFDPYYTTKIGGRGLGLTSAYSIVKNHGGCIDVESIPLKGSTFHVYLPASQKPLPEDAAQKVFNLKKTGKILIMDDEPDVVKMLARTLITLGCAPIGAKDGKEALEFLKNPEHQKEPFMAVILDLTIPMGMGGKEAVEKIRGFAPNLAVFVSSGYYNDPVIVEPKKYGFNGSLRKPFEVGELIELLNTV